MVLLTVTHDEPSFLQAIQQELDNLKAGEMRRRKARLKSVRVVGVTCSSSIREALAGQQFPVRIPYLSIPCVYSLFE